VHIPIYILLASALMTICFAVCAVDAASGKVTKVTASHFLAPCIPLPPPVGELIDFASFLFSLRLQIWKAQKESVRGCPHALGCFRVATLLPFAQFVVSVTEAVTVIVCACLTSARWSRLHCYCVDSEWINIIFDLHVWNLVFEFCLQRSLLLVPHLTPPPLLSHFFRFLLSFLFLISAPP
jgi:hypothetical protein